MKEIIVKHNKIIQASYKLTLNEQRILLYSLSKIDRENKKLASTTFYDIEIRDIADLFEMDENSAYKELKQAALRLKSRNITLKNNYVIDTGFIQSYRYKDNQGCLSIKFSDDILDYLTMLKENFTRYNLKDIKGFKRSSYSIRVYEILKQWSNSKNSVKLDLDELKSMFQLQDKYKSNSNFIIKVINPAIDDINEFSDLKVIHFEKFKTGRKLTHIVIYFELSRRSKKISDNYIKQHAKPGESWEQAKKRLVNYEL